MEKLQAIFQYLKDAGVVTDAAISKVTLFLVIAGILWAVVKAVGGSELAVRERVHELAAQRATRTAVRPF